MERHHFLLLTLLLQLVGLYSHASDDKVIRLNDPKSAVNVASPNYPDNSAVGTDGTWTVIGPTGSRLLLNCPEIYLPIADCSEGCLSIRDTPKEEKVCMPTTSYRRESVGNQLTIQFTTGPRGKGRFSCLLQLTTKDEVTTPTINTAPKRTPLRSSSPSTNALASLYPSGSASQATSSSRPAAIIPSIPASRASSPSINNWGTRYTAESAPQSTDPSINDSPPSINGRVSRYPSQDTGSSRLPSKTSDPVRPASAVADTGDYTGVIPQGDRQTSCPCGWTNKKRIVSGDEAKVNEFIFIAYLRYRSANDAFCGGSILTERHILTAAHCVIPIDVNGIYVVVGGHDFRYDNDNKEVQKISVLKKYSHENYVKGTTGRYDIGLLVLSEDIKYTNVVGPVCFPTEHGSKIIDQYVTAMGWGDLKMNGSSSPTLQSLRLQVVDMDNCSVHYGSRRASHELHLCTYVPNKGTCNGDSGGPVVYLDPELNRYVQVGIIATGYSCAEIPSLNTDVFAFTDWVQDKIRPIPGGW